MQFNKAYKLVPFKARIIKRSAFKVWKTLPLRMLERRLRTAKQQQMDEIFYQDIWEVPAGAIVKKQGKN